MTWSERLKTLREEAAFNFLCAPDKYPEWTKTTFPQEWDKLDLLLRDLLQDVDTNIRVHLESAARELENVLRAYRENDVPRLMAHLRRFEDCLRDAATNRDLAPRFVVQPSGETAVSEIPKPSQQDPDVDGVQYPRPVIDPNWRKKGCEPE